MLCCLCLLEETNTIGVFEEEGKLLNITGILSKHFWFKDDDVLSSHICINCWIKVDDFHVFYETVERSHNELKKRTKDLPMVKEEDIFPATVTVKQEVDENEYMIEDSELHAKIDYNNSDNTGNALDYDGGKTYAAYENQTIEKEECNYLITDVIKEEKMDEESANDDIMNNLMDSHSTKSFLGDYEEYDDTEYEYKDDDDTSSTLYEKQNSKKIQAGNISKGSTIKPTPAPSRFDPLYTEEMIKKHIKMSCSLCAFVGETFAHIGAHFKAEHKNAKAYITCCNKTFIKRCAIAEHAMKHENPDCFSCELCTKSYSTSAGLQKHNLKFHPSEKDLTFVCESCPKKFARNHLLELHKPSHIPRGAWNFFCPKCTNSKAYPTPYLLKMHDNRVHESDLYGETYKCPMCDKIYQNRSALSCHKRYVHSNKSFKCDHCAKVLKTSISLKEHMLQHTGKILYNCNCCTKAFNSNASLNVHKKKRHPAEWEAMQRQKLGINNAKH